jgi:hypothetical protein
MRQTRRATADPATAPGTTASATVIAVVGPVAAAVAGHTHTPTGGIDGGPA